jgi:hypothetical protein
MASYQDENNVKKTTSTEFDKIHDPGVAAPHAGIYRCIRCGHEIAIAQGHTLPPQSHPQHAPSLGSIQWKLLVFAVHNK